MTPDARPGAVYARRSVEDLNNPGLSIPFQIERGLQFWQSRGVNAPSEHIYVDADLSGKNLTERPDVLRLLTAMESGVVQGCWLYNVDRLTRNLYDLPTIQHAADAGRCAVYAGDRQLDWQNPEAEVGLIVETTFATYYRKRISKNTREALHKKSRDGLWAGGRLPWWLRTEGKGKLVVIEEHVPTLLRIFAEYVAGASTMSIAAGLARDGIPTPRGGIEWQHKTIHKIISHPTHYGRVHFAGDDNATQVPSPVPEALAEAALARLTASSHRRGPNTISHAFFRLVRCKLCGSACHRRRKVAHGQEYYSLQCNAVGRGGYGVDPCSARSVPWSQVELLESAVIGAFHEFHPVPRVWTPAPDYAELLVELEQRKMRETAILRAGACTIEQYEAVMRAINAEVARYAAPPPAADPDRYQGIAELWSGLNIGQQNAFMREIVEGIEVDPVHVVVTMVDLQWTEWPRLIVMRRSTGAIRFVF